MQATRSRATRGQLKEHVCGERYRLRASVSLLLFVTVSRPVESGPRRRSLGDGGSCCWKEP